MNTIDIAFTCCAHIVMAGLVPAIHVLFPKSKQKQDVDARDEPGHDG